MRKKKKPKVTLVTYERELKKNTRQKKTENLSRLIRYHTKMKIINAIYIRVNVFPINILS